MDFFYTIKQIGEPIFEWFADWEDDTRSTLSSQYVDSDNPTFTELISGDNEWWKRIFRGISNWWDELSSSDTGVDGFFYTIKQIGEPIFEWFADLEDDTRDSSLTYSDPPTIGQLIGTTTGFTSNVWWKRIIRGVTNWWDDLPETDASNFGTHSLFDQGFAHIKSFANSIVEPILEWWEGITLPDGTTDNFINRVWHGISSLVTISLTEWISSLTEWWEDLDADPSLESGLDIPFAYVKKFLTSTTSVGSWFLDTVVTPIQTWWNGITLPSGTTDNFQNRLWHGITGLGHTMIDGILDNLLDDSRNSNTVVQHIDRIWDKLYANATNVVGNIQTTIESATEQVETALNDAGNAVWNWINVNLNTEPIRNAVNTLTSWVGTATSIPELIGNTLILTRDAVVTALNGVGTDVWNWLNTNLNTTTIQGAINTLTTWVGSATSIPTLIANALTLTRDQVVTALNMTGTDIWNWLNNNLNTTTVQGAINTITSWVGTATNIPELISNTFTLTQDQIDDALEGLTFVSETITTWINTNLNTTTIQNAVNTLTDWIGSATSIPTLIGETLTLSGAAIIEALDDSTNEIWSNLNEIADDVGADISVWLTSKTTDIENALGATYAWLKIVYANSREKLEQSISWFGDSVNQIGTGVNTFLDAAKEILFNDLTPSAFAEGEIKASVADITTDGAIGKTINDDINEAFETFWEDTGDSLYQAGEDLTTTLQGIADFLTGTSNSGANTTLSNLTSPTSINQTLIFNTASSTIGGNDTTNIGAGTDGDMYFKIPSNDMFRFQINNDTKIEIKHNEVKINEPLVFENDTNGTNGTRSIGYSGNDLYLKVPDTGNVRIQKGSDSSIILGESSDSIDLSDIGESIIPDTSLTYNIGNSNNFWNNLYAEYVYLHNSDNFIFGADTGINYRVGSNDSHIFRIGNTESLILRNTGVLHFSTITTPTGLNLVTGGMWFDSTGFGFYDGTTTHRLGNDTAEITEAAIAEILNSDSSNDDTISSTTKIVIAENDTEVKTATIQNLVDTATIEATITETQIADLIYGSGNFQSPTSTTTRIPITRRLSDNTNDLSYLTIQQIIDTATIPAPSDTQIAELLNDESFNLTNPSTTTPVVLGNSSSLIQTTTISNILGLISESQIANRLYNSGEGSTLSDSDRFPYTTSNSNISYIQFSDLIDEIESDITIPAPSKAQIASQIRQTSTSSITSESRIVVAPSTTQIENTTPASIVSSGLSETAMASILNSSNVPEVTAPSTDDLVVMVRNGTSLVKIDPEELGGTEVEPEPMQPSDSVRAKIYATSTTPSSITSSTLDSQFGGQRGCFGIVTDTTSDSSSDQYFAVLGYSGWTLFNANGRILSKNVSGTEAVGSNTQSRMVAFQTSDIFPINSNMPTDRRTDGNLFVHSRSTGIINNFGIWYDNEVIYDSYNDSDHETASGGGSSSTTIALVGLIPISVADFTIQAAFNTAYGTAEGNIGYFENTAGTIKYFIFRVHGRWYRISLSNS